MKLSVIIPVLNEAKNLSRLIPFIFENGSHSVVEVIMVDGGSVDNSVETAKKLGAKVLHSPQKCRATQMNLGARASKGEVFYFVHADTLPVATFVSDIEAALEEGYMAGCYRYRFDSGRKILKINAYFTRFDRLMCRGGDQTLFILKEVFEDVGGYDEKYTIMEDYDFLIRLRRKYAFKIIPKNILVSARKYDHNSWLRVQLSNLTVFMMFYMKRSPEKMKKTYQNLLDYR
ncbi:TIGR04283 family arsenosugar biosynthesis glycosyltransferase [Pararhodonellum marinum]|uniref:TIGR04283 family arsenosugar biosynthesis glycosyltransferase n=1 Tax=Pararhodonellum marinum TaxID=2755358 RepID=UPI0018903577|nr:TIGR04283 family arsenosugar biosynthesis glycosyltransferase [Pararhodonellum marinum]